MQAWPILQKIQSWDMAFKDTKNSDFVVGQIHAADGADRYLLDQIRDRLDLPGTLLAVRRLSGQWPDAHLKLVEDKANGPAVIQSLGHQIGGLVEVNPEGGKISRAAGASPQLESGNWYLPHPMLKSWVDGFMAEWQHFRLGRTMTRWMPGASERNDSYIIATHAFSHNQSRSVTTAETAPGWRDFVVCAEN
jgi:predicted phage terminase large subunit-like protein